MYQRQKYLVYAKPDFDNVITVLMRVGHTISTSTICKKSQFAIHVSTSSNPENVGWFH